MGYFYPRSPCGERPHAKLTGTLDYSISIHALLAESDPVCYAGDCTATNFYPRSPCGERPTSGILRFNPQDFYPRSPCGERLATRKQNYLCGNFYPRSPCGERLFEEQTEQESTVISIHALLAESDGFCLGAKADSVTFLSTLSLRRATLFFGCDAPKSWYFYPRSPCGERPASHLSMCNTPLISIHALLAESDSHRAVNVQSPTAISIHALLAESDSSRFLFRLIL